MNEFWAAVWAVVWKDLRIEGRTRQTISIMVMFSLATLIMFNFGLGMAVNVNLSAGRDVSPALLWAVVLLAAILGLNRSLALDRENQVFDAQLIAPIPRTALYAGKVISITLFTLLLDAILVVLFTVFFNRPFYLPLVLLVRADHLHDHPGAHARGAAAGAAAAGVAAAGAAGGHGYHDDHRRGHGRRGGLGRCARPAAAGGGL